MKAHFRTIIIILVVGIVMIATMLISKQGPKSKTVVLAQSELKSKGVVLATSADTGITRYDIDNPRYTGYILEIKDPKRIKVGYSKNLGKEGETTSNIAKDNNAIAAINGGGFTDKGAGFQEGIIMFNYTLIGNINENSKISVMGITKEGVLIVGEHNLKELKNLGVTEAISFGPCIVLNGVGQISLAGGQGVSPRTAIGQKADGTIVLLVIDGRQLLKVGATLKDVENIMLERNVVNATSLDGGSSSTMYYNGALINKPSATDGERLVSTVVYVTP
ncbi:MAG: phosphodiester glycosidase family protein [Clostridiaceae bacterium]|nr:phosphodiester glycosidase family protein [Clostridiaceae bacterium]